MITKQRVVKDVDTSALIRAIRDISRGGSAFDARSAAADVLEAADGDADRWPDASGGMPSRDRFFRNPADSDGRSRACLGGLHERLSCYLTKEASNHG